MTALWVIVLCGALSIVYAIWATASVMKADAGNPRMQEIAAAVAEGAQAYLKRQYMTIGIVGVVIFALLAYFLGMLVAVGFLIGAVLSGAAGFIGMNVSVRANVRTAQAATTSLAGGLELAFKAGAITGMLVAGLALLGVTIYFAYLTQFLGLAGQRPHRGRRAGRARLRRLADLDLRPSRRRHLHQGRGRRRRSRRQGRSRHSRGRSAQPGHHRRQRRRQCRRLRRHGRRPVRDLCGDRGRHHGAGRDLLCDLAAAGEHDDAAARHRRRLHHHLDHRHLLRQARRQPVDHGRAVQGPDRDRHPVAARRRRRHLLADRLRSAGGREVHRHGAVRMRRRRPRRHRADHLDHRILHRHRLSPGEVDRGVLGHRSRHQRDPGSGDLDGIHRRSGAGDHRRHPRHLQPCRPVRHRDCHHHDAGAGRHDRGARRLRPGHRQRRRHCRNGRPAEGSPQVDRRARRGRQHHQGGHQGLRDRLGRSRRAGAVCGLQ